MIAVALMLLHRFINVLYFFQHHCFLSGVEENTYSDALLDDLDDLDHLLCIVQAFDLESHWSTRDAGYFDVLQIKQFCRIIVYAMRRKRK